LENQQREERTNERNGDHRGTKRLSQVSSSVVGDERTAQQQINKTGPVTGR
jgi:hypothetical protein